MINPSYYPLIAYVGAGILGSALEWAGLRLGAPVLVSVGKRLEGLGLDVFKTAAPRVP